MSEAIIRPIDIDRDAEKLAAMWNASDMEWPAPFSQGVPITDEQARVWVTESHPHLMVLVAEVDGEIVGYCTFMERPAGEGYLAVLNVAPGHQGHSIGRKLIQATIERSVQEGWQRQTLRTWSANFKAMRVYKKTGHFWAPDTSVRMENFIPGALQFPLAQPFFQRHDWYESYQPDINHGMNDERWEGIPAFRQHWEADGEALTIWIDREARAPMAAETDAVQIAALVDNPEPLTGSTINLRWRVVNKGTQPLSVIAHTAGGDGLSVDHRDAFRVPPGETVERAVPVRVADDAPQNIGECTAPAIRSVFRLGDQEVSLFSGVRPRRPLRLDTTPAEITVMPGVAVPLHLQLYSELDAPATLNALIVPPEGLTVSPRQAEIELPARGQATLPLMVTAEQEGVYTLPVRVECANREGVPPLAETLTLFSLAAGGLLANQTAQSARLETDALRITVDAAENALRIADIAANRVLLEAESEIGLPFFPPEFAPGTLTLVERAGRATVRLEAAAKRRPGLTLCQEFTLSPTGLGSLTCYLENRGREVQDARLMLMLGAMPLERHQITLPLTMGLVHSDIGRYPHGWQDAPGDPQAYAEPWLALESEGTVMGAAWDGPIERLDFGRRVDLNMSAQTLGPGQRSQPVRLGLYAQRGDWRAARRVLLAWAGKPTPAEGPTPRPPVLARLEPSVLVTVEDQEHARLVVDSVSRRAENGRVELQAEGGLVAQPNTVQVARLQREQAVVQDIALQLPQGRLGVYQGQARLTTELSEEVRPFHVVRAGTPAPVQVAPAERQEQPVWTIHNGVSEFVIAPGFGPSVVAWHLEGVNQLDNQLFSYFPRPDGFSFQYPWFGGIHALLMPADRIFWEGMLHRDVAEAEPLRVADASGLPWQGVRLRTRPSAQSVRDFQVELDFTTLGESRLLRLVYRLRNLQAVEQQARMGWNVACRLGACPEDLILRGEGITRHPTPWAAFFQHKTWGALSNPATGRTLLLVSQQADVVPRDVGRFGRILEAGDEVRLAANTTREFTYYLILADTWEEAQPYLALQEYDG